MVPPLVLRWDIRPREINLILRLPPPALRHHLPRPRIILHLQMNHGSSNSNYCSSSSNSNNNQITTHSRYRRFAGGQRSLSELTAKGLLSILQCSTLCASWRKSGRLCFKSSNMVRMEISI